MIPYKADVPMQRWPYANWAIMAVTVILSIVAHYLPGEVELQLAQWTKDPSAVIEDINKQVGFTAIDPSVAKEYGFHFYQLITSSLVHDGFWHLFGNMVFLFVFGNAINAKIGHVPYVALYVLYAIVTSLAWYFFPGDGLFLVGASGAIMGIAGMFSVLYPLNSISMFMFLLFRPLVFQLSAIWVLLGYFVLDLLGFLGPSDGISHISHVSGMLSGAAVAGALLLSGAVLPGRGEKTLLEVLGMKVKRMEPYERPASKLGLVTTVVPPQMRATHTVAGGERRVPPAPPSGVAPAAVRDLPSIGIEPLKRQAREETSDELGPIELEPPDER